MKAKLTQLQKQITELDLVKIENKAPGANTETLDAYITELTTYVDESIKNDLDVEVVDTKIKEIKHTKEGFTDYRKSWTTPLDSVKKEFTSREKLISEQISKLVGHKEKMLEDTYKIAEQAIREVFQQLQIDNDNIVPDMSVFDSFLEAQRKVKGMLPNEKGVLGKASLEKIEKEFEKHVTPIREAQEQEATKAKEQKQFEMYIGNYDTNSKNISELEAVVINLEQLKAQVPELYPSIQDHCMRTIENKIGLAKGNVNTLKALEAQAKAEAIAKEAVAEVEEVKNADDEILKEAKAIEDGLDIIKDDKTLLGEQKRRLGALWMSCTYVESKDAMKVIGERISEMMSAIPSEEDDEIVTEKFTVTGTISDMKALVKFLNDRGVKYE